MFTKKAQHPGKAQLIAWWKPITEKNNVPNTYFSEEPWTYSIVIFQISGNRRINERPHKIARIF